MSCPFCFFWMKFTAHLCTINCFIYAVFWTCHFWISLNSRFLNGCRILFPKRICFRLPGSFFGFRSSLNLQVGRTMSGFQNWPKYLSPSKLSSGYKKHSETSMNNRGRRWVVTCINLFLWVIGSRAETSISKNNTGGPFPRISWYLDFSCQKRSIIHPWFIRGSRFHNHRGSCPVGWVLLSLHVTGGGKVKGSSFLTRKSKSRVLKGLSSNLI